MKKAIIMGAAGRDFHNFNVYFRDNDQYQVVAFTATQIPDIEEREEYEPHIQNGIVVYAGVDYQAILEEAEREADIILWDGGNNDFSFYHSNLEIVVVDPHRAGHELLYHPGETNFRRAQVFVINKIDTAEKEKFDLVVDNIRQINPKATVIRANSPVFIADEKEIADKKVLVIEDGPTLTHGEMPYGAGVIVRYELEETGSPNLEEVLGDF